MIMSWWVLYNILTYITMRMTFVTFKDAVIHYIPESSLLLFQKNYCLMMPFLIVSGAGCALHIFSIVVLFFSMFTNVALVSSFILELLFTGNVDTTFFVYMYCYYLELHKNYCIGKTSDIPGV